MLKEEWKNIWHAGIRTEKWISSYGRVKNDKGVVLEGIKNSAGYLSVAIASISRKPKPNLCVRKYIHRLVAEYFIADFNPSYQINHKNCDKQDNSVSNLEVVTNAENIRHAHENGRMEKRSKTKVRYMTKEEIVICYLRIKAGETISEVSQDMGIPRTTLSSLINKRSHKVVTDSLDS